MGDDFYASRNLKPLHGLLSVQIPNESAYSGGLLTLSEESLDNPVNRNAALRIPVTIDLRERITQILRSGTD